MLKNLIFSLIFRLHAVTVNAESLTVYDLEHEPYIFGNNFRLRGRSALFLVSLDTVAVFIRIQTEKFGAAAASGTVCTTVSAGVIAWGFVF